MFRHLHRALLVISMLLGCAGVGACDPSSAESHEASAELRESSAERSEVSAEPIGGEPAVVDPAGPDPERAPGATPSATDEFGPEHTGVGTPPDPTAASADGPLPRVAWPPTSLSLAVLATMGSQDPAQSRATIRDEDNGVISSYRPGDHVRPRVEVLAVEDGVVELSNAGEVEYLSISAVPVALSADDAFYPDLVDHLHLSTSMGDGILMPPGPDYTLKAELFSWGTPRTIALLRDAIHEYARPRNVPAVHIGDISRRGGGPFPPHLSHHEGRDVDIAYVLHDPQARFRSATERSLDRPRTWALLHALLDTNAVVYIFVDYDVQRLLYEHAQLEGVDDVTLDRLFQYPYGRRASHGVIRHWKGHRDHFHVRFER